MTGDGNVNMDDLLVIANNWLTDFALLGHWEVDGDALDSSGYMNDATVVGDALWQPEGGQVDGALLLDGQNDYVSTLFVLDPAVDVFSVFAWVKGGALGQVLVSQVLGANWLLADSSSGNLMTDLKESGRSGKALLSDTVITDGNWHRVGLVWDGINRILYVDDVVVATDAQAELVGSLGGLNISCGKNLAPNSFWSGLIDDVRIYNRVVTPSEI